MKVPPRRLEYDRRWRLHAQLKSACAQHEARVRRANETLARSVSAQRGLQRQIQTITIRRHIQGKLIDGCLPSARPAIVVGRPGNGANCAGCGSELGLTQLTMEIPTSEGRFAYLYADCFIMWDDVRRRIATLAHRES